MSRWWFPRALFGLLGLLAAAGHGPAAVAQQTSGLPIPRFVSIDTDRANLRAGPGMRYPVEWVLVREGMPVEVIAEYDNWRRVRDFEGTVGWLHRSLLSGRRTVIITGAVRPLRRRPDISSPVILRAEPGVLGDLEICRDQWCLVDIGGRRGWIVYSDFWGVYPGENPG